MPAANSPYTRVDTATMVYSANDQEEDNLEAELQPLDFIDIIQNNAYEEEDTPERILKDSNVFSVAMNIPRKRPICDTAITIPMRWQRAAKKVLCLEDPFGAYHLEKCETEKVLRHRFCPLKKDWKKDEILVKMSKEPFGRGAMRECFRLKRIRPMTQSSLASNYVAKRYMTPVDRDVYESDVMLQMFAKMWSAEFNKSNPPKKVDFCQMAIIEFLDRPGKPVYHLEHFIEGKYIKYNGNSGFISEHARCTPQAFSHFTFEKSGHELIVVDIQGVGDLYTDPQIHSSDETLFNEGNLGIKGMALFFQSHICNPICKSLGLSQFDKSEQERHSPVAFNRNGATCVKPMNVHQIVGSPRPEEFMDIFMGKRTRYHTYTSPSDVLPSRSRSWSVRQSVDSQGRDETSTPSPPIDYNPHGFDEQQSMSSESEDAIDVDIDFVMENLMFSDDDDCRSMSSRGTTGRRMRCDSECSLLSEAENERLAFQRRIENESLPSDVAHEVEFRARLEHRGLTLNPSLLGRIHLELCRYYENGRFSDEDDPLNYDKDAALFHLEMAARCQNVEAILAFAKMYQNLPHDILEAVEIPKDSAKAIMYLKLAADAGDRLSMVQLAKEFDSKKDWMQAIELYSRAIALEYDEGGEYDCHGQDAVYMLQARVAEMYAQGGNGLDEDKEKAFGYYQEAAEKAMSAAKGRLANKYYELAEALGV